MTQTRILFLLCILCLGVLAAACDSRSSPGAAQGSAPASSPRGIVLATTTSTEDSGLLHVLLPEFTKATGIEVKTVAVGSGQAMELGKRGEADVLLVHSPKAEEEYMASGAGADRRPVMHNDFVLLGPAADPAAVKGEATAAGAMAKVAAKGASFVSRSDKSGTHSKERSLWEVAAIEPKGTWYIESGAGMGETLRIASEKQAYTLSDRATFFATSGLDLVVLFEEVPVLLNPYHVISVVGSKVNAQGAKAFTEFLTGDQGRRLIAGFRCPKSGQLLFFPDPSDETR